MLSRVLSRVLDRVQRAESMIGTGGGSGEGEGRNAGSGFASRRDGVPARAKLARGWRVAVGAMVESMVESRIGSMVESMIGSMVESRGRVDQLAG